MTRSVTIESTYQIRPPWFEYDHHDWDPRFDMIWYVPIRSGALLHVHYDPMRSVVIGYEFALNYCPDHDKRWYDLATIGPNRHINSQADSIHLLHEPLQGKNYNPRPSIMEGFEVDGWLDWLRPIGWESIAKIFFYLVLIASIPQGLQIQFIFHLFLFLVRGPGVCSDFISFFVIVYLCTSNILLKMHFWVKMGNLRVQIEKCISNPT